ncbi:hypothetical protein ABI59_23070 [Acidobacteria bacterium Mor1]|nr:hypothetical protein ABI59_23070 [Acidobacteria bacterium Mor1]
MSISETRTELLAERASRLIRDGFRGFLVEFGDLSRQAAVRFARAEWAEGQEDARSRLETYPAAVSHVVARVRELYGDASQDLRLWRRTKALFAVLLDDEENPELARTFFSSVSRRVFGTIGIDPEIEFVLETSALAGAEDDPRAYRSYACPDMLAPVVRQILEDYRFPVDYADLDGDARLVAGEVASYLQAVIGVDQVDAFETLVPVFYRSKGAYIIGRIRSGNQTIPFVLPLRHAEGGVAVDAVLLSSSEVSILFSFTRSYFQVDAPCARSLIAFLKSIIPLKSVAELYINLGFDKHGKAELFLGLRRHLESSGSRFEFAAGEVGMVMIVLTLPYYDMVFKIIRDRFAYPKSATREKVRRCYRMVYEADRVGRLVEAQPFESLRFPRSLFRREVLAELEQEAGHAVTFDGDDVVLEHLYMERKVTPLNLYVQQADQIAARRALVDYGDAIKELSAANIFPGDFLLKNFGVTRHGRVVFYDYDELCLVTECTFRRIPPPRTVEDELSPEPWFVADEFDIFPEEFHKFLELTSPMLEVFRRHHGDLFDLPFWRGIQERLRAGEIVDVFPYPSARRFQRTPGGLEDEA